jgi:two-component system response regulator AtoC
LLRYSWPGNVRELENLLVRAAVVARGQTLGRADFPDLIDDVQSRGADMQGEDGRTESGRYLTLDEVEEMHIRRVLRSNSDKNKGEVCEILGISRPTFERKLEKYEITFERD